MEVEEDLVQVEYSVTFVLFRDIVLGSVAIGLIRILFPNLNIKSNQRTQVSQLLLNMFSPVTIAHKITLRIFTWYLTLIMHGQLHMMVKIIF